MQFLGSLRSSILSMHSRWLYVLAFLLPTGAYIYGGAFSRFIADDYCVAALAADRSAWQTYQYFYETWSGRFSYYIVTDWLMQPGAVFYSLVPAAFMGIWFVSLLWLINLLVRDVIGWTQPTFRALLLTSLMMYGIFAGTPNLEQSIYWVTGAVTYVTPLIILTIYATLTLSTFLKLRRRWFHVVALVSSGTLLFIAIGFSETTAALQIFLVGSAWLWAAFFAPNAARKQLLVWLGAGLIGSLLALMLLASAPGNSIRRGTFEAVLSLPDVSLQTLQVTLAFLAGDLAIFAPLPILTVLFAATAVGYAFKSPGRYGQLNRTQMRRGLALMGGFAIVITAVCTAPSVYAMSVAPPARVYLLPHTFIVGAVVVCGLLMGFRIRSSDPTDRLARSVGYRVVLFGSLTLVLAVTTGNAIARANTYRLYAADWDARDAAIRAEVSAGETNVQAAPLEHDLVFVTHLDDLSADPASDINRCAASYYHAASLTIADSS